MNIMSFSNRIYHTIQRLSLFKKILIVVILVFIGWFGVTRISGQKSNQSQVQTAQVERGTLITSVTTSGTISSGSSVNITTSATGVVNTVYAKNGDTVNQGDKIADITLDQSSLQQQSSAWASYLSAQNNLDSAKAKMNSLQASLFKANQAFVTDRGVSNPSDQQKADPVYIEENATWLQAESDYNNQKGVISQAEAALNSAWLSYSELSSTVTAPIGGVISNLNISEGLPITSSNTQSSSSTTSNSSSNPSSSQSLGTIILENNKIQATVNLSEIDVTHVKVGQNVTITLDAFPSKTFTGKVAAINTNGSVSSGVTTYPTTVVLDTVENNIYPNMGANAKIITSIRDNVLLVPTTAVQTQNGSSYVRVMKNNQVQQVAVEVGDSNDTQSEITSGLSEGDVVVTSSQTQTTTNTSTSSPFGGTGFGGIRTGGGGVGGANRGFGR